MKQLTSWACTVYNPNQDLVNANKFKIQDLKDLLLFLYIIPSTFSSIILEVGTMNLLRAFSFISASLFLMKSQAAKIIATIRTVTPTLMRRNPYLYKKKTKHFKKNEM